MDILLSGFSYSVDAPWGNNGLGDAIIVKYDFCGNMIWTENFGGEGVDIFQSVATAHDGFVAARKL